MGGGGLFTFLSPNRNRIVTTEMFLPFPVHNAVVLNLHRISMPLLCWTSVPCLFCSMTEMECASSVRDKSNGSPLQDHHSQVTPPGSLLIPGKCMKQVLTCTL